MNLSRLKNTSELAHSLVERNFKYRDVEATASADKKSILDSILLNLAILPTEDNVDSLVQLVVSLVEEVQALNAGVNYLQGEIAKLEKGSTDQEEESEFSGVEDFLKSLQGKRITDLKYFYNLSFFRGVSEKVRVILCRELINFVADKNIDPSSVWVKLVNNNGKI
jgi:hypothetical protein